MEMFNPPHPGKFIKEVYIDELEVTEAKIAKNLNVSASTLNRLIKGSSSVTPEMAIRLSITLGRSAESWMLMQDKYSLFQLKNEKKFQQVLKLEFSA